MLLLSKISLVVILILNIRWLGRDAIDYFSSPQQFFATREIMGIAFLILIISSAMIMVPVFLYEFISKESNKMNHPVLFKWLPIFVPVVAIVYVIFYALFDSLRGIII